MRLILPVVAVLTGGLLLLAQRKGPLPPPPGKGVYDLGIHWGAMDNLFGDDSAWREAATLGNTAYIQRSWAEDQNHRGRSLYDALSTEARIARGLGMKLYISVEALSATRNAPSLPRALKGRSFGDPAVQTAYLSDVVRIASELQPEYMVLCVEVNIYEQYDAAGYNAYRALYPAAYQAVKAASPNTKVAVSFAYIGDNQCMGASARQSVARALAHFAPQDIFAVSTYPLCFMDANIVPVTFLADIAALSSLPFFLAETGWPSEPFIVNGASFPTSEEAQQVYYSRIVQCADYLYTSGRLIAGINFVTLADIPQALRDQVCTGELAALCWYGSLGMIGRDGRRKFAHQFLAERQAGLNATTF